MRRKILKIFVFLTYPLLIVGLLGLGVLYFVRNRDYTNLNSAYVEATQSLNEENQDKQVTIDDLRNTYQELNNQITDLKTENASLKASLDKLQAVGNGTISGEILPFVTAGIQDFQQYQIVCAELISNGYIQHCVTVSAIQQDYTLTVPAGNYRVYAEIFPKPAAEAALGKYRGFYTKYVNCVQVNTSECNQNEMTDSMEIVVKAGETVGNVDPVDWKQIGQ